MTPPLPVIRGLRARPVVAPLARPVRTAVGTIPAAPLVLIDVETDAGITGRAYLFGHTPVTLAPLTALLGTLGEMVAGETVDPAARQAQLFAAFRLLGCQGLLGMAMSGLDVALWDARGRMANKPVVELLGGGARPVPAYDSYGVVDPVADRTALEASLAQGFRAIKIKLGDGDLARDATTVAAVRDIVGADVALMVDYNQSRTVAEAIRRIEALARYDLTWVEEPVPAEDLAGHAAVRDASPVPVQTGENWWFPWDLARAIAAGASDLAMPDLMKIGGITGWLEAVALAADAGLPVSSHIFAEASAHVLPVTPTAHWLEHLDLAGDLLAEPVRVVDGAVTARGPGLGLDWDEAAVARHAA